MNETLKRAGNTKFNTNLTIQAVYPFKFKAWRYANGYIKIDTCKIPKDPFIKNGDGVEGSKKKKWSKFACGYVFKNIFEKGVG